MATETKEYTTRLFSKKVEVPYSISYSYQNNKTSAKVLINIPQMTLNSRPYIPSKQRNLLSINLAFVFDNSMFRKKIKGIIRNKTNKTAQATLDFLRSVNELSL